MSRQHHHHSHHAPDLPSSSILGTSHHPSPHALSLMDRRRLVPLHPAFHTVRRLSNSAHPSPPRHLLGTIDAGTAGTAATVMSQAVVLAHALDLDLVLARVQGPRDPEGGGMTIPASRKARMKRIDAVRPGSRRTARTIGIIDHARDRLCVGANSPVAEMWGRIARRRKSAQRRLWRRMAILRSSSMRSSCRSIRPTKSISAITSSSSSRQG